MPKKKILIFIDWYLPGYRAGGPIRSVANLVANLSGTYEFSVVTRDTDYASQTAYSGINTNAWNRLADGTNVYYFSGDKLSAAAIRDLIDSTPYDAIYLNGIYSWYFTLVPLLHLRKKKNSQIIVAARGMLSPGSLGVKRAKKKLFLFAATTLGLFRDILFHATTSAEADDIRHIMGRNVNVHIAGNLPQKPTGEKPATRIKSSGDLSLVNIARIAPEKNLAYALRLLAMVRGKVRFDFYGPLYDKKYWEECQLLIAKLPSNVTVSYRESVESEKVNEVLSKYHMMLMPSTGENFGHIILQSLSAGCPVIISDRTPWKGLAAPGVGWDIPLNDEETFVRTIEECIAMDQPAFDAMSAKAARYAENYSRDPSLITGNIRLFA